MTILGGGGAFWTIILFNKSNFTPPLLWQIAQKSENSLLKNYSHADSNPRPVESIPHDLTNEPTRHR